MGGRSEFSAALPLDHSPNGFHLLARAPPRTRCTMALLARILANWLMRAWDREEAGEAAAGAAGAAGEEAPYAPRPWTAWARDTLIMAAIIAIDPMGFLQSILLILVLLVVVGAGVTAWEAWCAVANRWIEEWNRGVARRAEAQAMHVPRAADAAPLLGTEGAVMAGEAGGAAAVREAGGAAAVSEAGEKVD